MKSVYNPDDLTYIDHDGVIHETDKAKLFSIEGDKVWLPKSKIRDEGDDIVAIPKWLAEKKGLESSWV